jgi:hypothetical protein
MNRRNANSLCEFKPGPRIVCDGTGSVDGIKKIPHNKIMDINERLEYIDSLKKELDSLRPLSRELATGLKQVFDVDLTYNSTAMEGNTFSFQETKMLLMEGITAGGNQCASIWK